MTMKINDSFSRLLSDIENSLALSRAAGSGGPVIHPQKKPTSNFQMTSSDIDGLIAYAKEFEVELKNYVEKQKLREKMKQRHENDIKSMAIRRKSSFPPIWNNNHEQLSDYIENVLDGLFLVPEVETDQASSMENLKDKRNRNVGTNIKFRKTNNKLIQMQTTQKNSITQTELGQNVTEIDKNSSGKTSKNINNLANTSLFPIRGSDTKILNKLQPEIELGCSTTTYTSTTGKGQNSQNATICNTMTTKRNNIQLLPVLSIKGECRIQSVYKIEILPTSNNDNDNSVCHKETNFNVKYCEFIHSEKKVSDDDEKPTTSNIDDDYQVKQNNKNPIKSDVIVNEDGDKAAERQQENNVIVIDGKNDDNRNNKNVFIEVKDLSKFLADHGLIIRDESQTDKHMKIESNEESPNIESTSKEPLTKNFENEFPLENHSRQSGKASSVCSEKSSSMMTESQNLKMRKILRLNDIERKRERRNRNKKMGKCYCAIKINCPSNSSSVYETSSETETSQKIATITNKNSNSSNCSESKHSDAFSNIYKLVENTFETSEDSLKVEGNDIDSKMKLDDDNDADDVDGNEYTKKIIKLSEENIRKAGMLLAKYRRYEENDKIITAIRTASSSPLKKLSTNQIEIVDTSANIIKSQYQNELLNLREKLVNSDKKLICQGVQTNLSDLANSPENEKIIVEKDVVKSCDDYNSFTNGLNNVNVTPKPPPRAAPRHSASFHHDCQGELKNALNSSAVQTEATVCSSSHPIFQDVYKTFPQLTHHVESSNFCFCIGCKMTRKPTPQNPIAMKRTLIYSSSEFNSNSYSDDEIMRAANKFLKSVEKRKHRNADSDISSDTSGWEELLLKSTSKKAESGSNSSIGTKNTVTPEIGNLLEFSSDENEKKSNLKKAEEIERKISNMELPADQGDLLSLSPVTLSSSRQLVNDDINQEIQDIENSLAYLSDGEVLSQGEFKF